jgi:phosphoglycerol transferase MdoB-like AlkP superfamily enzyme
MSGLRSGVAEESAPESDLNTGTDSDVTEETPSRPPSRIRQVLTIVGSLAMTVLWAWLVVVVLNASNFPQPFVALRDRLFDAPVLLQSVAVVWVVVLLVLAVVGRLWISLGLVTALTALIGAVNATKLDLRNDPVYPYDVTFLRQPGFLFEMVPTSRVLSGAVGLVAVVVIAALVGWLVGKVLPTLGKTLTRRGLIALRLTRVVVALACLGLLNLASDFNEPGNPWRAAFDSTGLRWRHWDQRVNYQANGFVSGLLFNMHVTAMKEPQGYSKAAVEEITERYRARAAAMNKGRTATIDKTNVVIILSEGFSNPAWLKTVKFPENPIPRTTAIMEQTVSGKMLAPGFGSGTANTEYELLTGQSLSQLSPQLSTPYEQLVSRYKDYPSAVQYLEDHGHKPVAIHPFSPRMYARPKVFNAFGFDEFITKDQMKFKGRGGGRFIDDKSAYNEVQHQIDTNDRPVLAHLITMQNHMPFGGQYDDPINPTGLPPKYTRLAGQYARGIARSDEALATLFADLKKSPEPTAVIFYGDHLPPQVYPQSLVKREGILTSHQTPFLIWSNRKPLPHTDLPTTSPTQFMPKLFNALQVPIPPWFALLDALDKQVPAMDTGIAVNAQDEQVKPSQLGPEAKKVLADYRMIMYDLSIGKRYSEKAMYEDAPTG